jgi:methionine synthase II (cobalamin-independent)
LPLPAQAKSKPPFRAEHIGSLPRQPQLIDAFMAYARRQLDDEPFRAIQDLAIVEAVRLQEEAAFIPSATVSSGFFLE